MRCTQRQSSPLDLLRGLTAKTRMMSQQDRTGGDREAELLASRGMRFEEGQASSGDNSAEMGQQRQDHLADVLERGERVLRASGAGVIPGMAEEALEEEDGAMG